MDALRRLENFPSILESYIKKRRLTRITNYDSHAILREIAEVYKIPPSVSNLFAINVVMTPGQYMNHVLSKLRPPTGTEKQPILSRQISQQTQQRQPVANDLDRAEQSLFSDHVKEVPINVPNTKDINTILTQMNQWTSNTTKVLPGGKEALTKSIEESLSDAEDSLDKVTSTKRNPRDDDDDDDDEDQAVVRAKPEAPVEKETPTTFCLRLLENKQEMSNYCNRLYDVINPEKDPKIGVHRTQHFIDELVEKGFEKQKLTSCLRSLINAEFVSMRELNYTQFCYFVRSILQKYSDS